MQSNESAGALYGTNNNSIIWYKVGESQHTPQYTKPILVYIIMIQSQCIYFSLCSTIGYTFRNSIVIYYYKLSPFMSINYWYLSRPNLLVYSAESIEFLTMAWVHLTWHLAESHSFWGLHSSPEWYSIISIQPSVTQLNYSEALLLLRV